MNKFNKEKMADHVTFVDIDGTAEELIQGREYVIAEKDIEYCDNSDMHIVFINDIGYGLWRFFEIVEV